jgi:hypothetical protein
MFDNLIQRVIDTYHELAMKSPEDSFGGFSLRVSLESLQQEVRELMSEESVK